MRIAAPLVLIALLSAVLLLALASPVGASPAAIPFSKIRGGLMDKVAEVGLVAVLVKAKAGKLNEAAAAASLRGKVSGKHHSSEAS